MIPVWLTDTLTSDIARSIHYTLLWGLEGVALRTVDRDTVVPDVNEPKLRRRLAEAELPVVAVEPGLFECAPEARALWLNDIERLAETVAFCQRMDCPLIISGALPGGDPDLAAQALRRAAGRLAGTGRRLCLRNQGSGRTPAAGLARLLRETASPSVMACWDPATALLQDGEAPLDGLAALGEDIAMVIARDVRLARPDAATPFGEGDVGWEALTAALARRGFRGPICLAFRGVQPAQALRDATALIQMIRAARRNAPTG